MRHAHHTQTVGHVMDGTPSFELFPRITLNHWPQSAPSGNEGNLAALLPVLLAQDAETITPQHAQR